MGMQDMIRWLLPREDVFYSLLERQSEILDAAARALAEFSNGVPAEQIRDSVQKLEHDADAIVYEIEELCKTAAVLRAELPALRRHEYGKLIALGRVIKTHEKEADQVFRNAVSALFHDDAIDAKILLRDKEVLEDLESAIDRCETVAERLKNLAVKHG